MNQQSIDLVGDIHGAVDRLRKLIEKLGYRKSEGRWSHPDQHRLVFLGDYADKGPRVAEAIELVRELCDARVACAIAGNHDTNAIAFCMKTADSKIEPRDAWRSTFSANKERESWVRPHDSKNLEQHCRTLQLDEAAYAQAIQWFTTLPLWLELPGLRAVHAAWIPSAIAKIKSMDDARWKSGSAWLEAASIDEAIEMQQAQGARSAFTHQGWRLLLDLKSELDPATGTRVELDKRRDAERSTPEATHAVALERILKGVECPLGDEMSLEDASGHERRQVRIKWYDAAIGRRVVEHALVPEKQHKKIVERLGDRDFAAVAESIRRSDPKCLPLESLIPYHARDAYPADERPVFVGHYGFLHSVERTILRDNVACLDTSAFDPVHGKLAAYRWRGERRLDASRVEADA
jgi:hypothetical protein